MIQGHLFPSPLLSVVLGAPLGQNPRLGHHSLVDGIRSAYESSVSGIEFVCNWEES